ncbi:hypothetical protein M8396_14495, partial [Staphylococcus aureus]|nr:hypothetical protein [Staphylococcus aureus]
AWKERVRQTIPELPDERKAKYVNELGLPAYDAHVLTLTKEMSAYSEQSDQMLTVGNGWEVIDEDQLDELAKQQEQDDSESRQVD